MEEEEFLNNDDQQKQIRYSIERYEEMIRNKDAYFFDVDAFVNIVDYYIEKNDPVTFQMSPASSSCGTLPLSSLKQVA